MKDVLLSLWHDSTLHQLAVGLALSVCMKLGAALSAQTGVMKYVGMGLQKLSDWLGANVKH